MNIKNTILAFAIIALTCDGQVYGDHGFETGDFTFWSTTGPSVVVDDSFGVMPANGMFQGAIGTGANSFGGPVSDSTIEFFLGYVPGSIDAITGGDAIEGAAMSGVFSLGDGDTIAFAFDFLTNESAMDPFANDSAFWSVQDSSGAFLVAPSLIANTFSSLSSSASGTPDFGFFFDQTGYGTTLSFTSPSAGDYEFAFGVVDLGDGLIDSALLVDSGPAPAVAVPEPGTGLLLVGSCLVGILVNRRRSL